MKVKIRSADILDGGLVAWYLMASYLYYERNISIMDDHEYDLICKRLDKAWDRVDHPHKHVVDRGALSATTGYYLRGDQYPLMTRSAAVSLANKLGLYA